MAELTRMHIINKEKSLSLSSEYSGIFTPSVRTESSAIDLVTVAGQGGAKRVVPKLPIGQFSDDTKSLNTSYYKNFLL